MSRYDPKKIEEYQLILLKNPGSKVFAALAEAYRKMGLLEEALDTAQKGVFRHPDYPSGRVALARILIEEKRYSEATPHLDAALKSNNGNLLALRMQGHCWFQVKNYRSALASYKKLLFFHPNDEAAQEFVKKWEFLEAQGYEKNALELLSDEEIEAWAINLPTDTDLIAVVDASLTTGDFSSARRFLKLGFQQWPESEKIKKRWDHVQMQDPQNKEQNLRKAFWEKWLQRVESSPA